MSRHIVRTLNLMLIGLASVLLVPCVLQSRWVLVAANVLTIAANLVMYQANRERP